MITHCVKQKKRTACVQSNSNNNNNNMNNMNNNSLFTINPQRANKN